MTETISAAEHRAQAEQDLAMRRGQHAASDIYKNLTQSAIAHAGIAIGQLLESFIPPPEPEAPQVPGLPLGWKIATTQNPEGERWWRYELTPPQPAGIIVSRYRWAESETALAAGIRYANSARDGVEAEAIDQATVNGTPVLNPGPSAVLERRARSGRVLSREERIEARHWLQQLSEQARSVRDAMDPLHGMQYVTDNAWRDQWAALKKELDQFTARVTLDLPPLGGVGDRNA
jgi:hypothetical protein